LPVAGLLVIAVVFLAVFAPLLVGHDPYVGGADALLPPWSKNHPLGTDDLGRDIWAELAFGARVSLIVGVVTAASGLVIGVAVGALAGYAGGVLDAILMRVSEFFQTLPRFVLALIVIALFGPGRRRAWCVPRSPAFAAPPSSMPRASAACAPGGSWRRKSCRTRWRRSS
jgi:ABC-type dipeptide/oligopeptide/nickel transport system permease subunit